MEQEGKTYRKNGAWFSELKPGEKMPVLIDEDQRSISFKLDEDLKKDTKVVLFKNKFKEKGSRKPDYNWKFYPPKDQNASYEQRHTVTKDDDLPF